MFSGRPSVRASVRDSRCSYTFPRYLQYLLTDFRQTFVTGASWDTDDLVTFLGQKVKVQGHTIAAEAHSTRRYHRVQLFLAFSEFLIFLCNLSQCEDWSMVMLPILKPACAKLLVKYVITLLCANIVSHSL